MGFFNKIMGGSNRRHLKGSDRLIEGYLRGCENLYNLCVTMYPEKDPHEHLVITLCTIWTKSGAFKETEIDKPLQSSEIVAYTLLPACLSAHYRPRVLAYKLIMEDKELSTRFRVQYPACYDEYIKVSRSIWDAKRNGSLKELYCRYNRNKTHQDILFHSRNKHEKEADSPHNYQDKYTSGNIVYDMRRLIGQVSKTLAQQRISLLL